MGSGKGGDLGGLNGADAHCQQLAAAVGAGNKTWRAYLSTQIERPDARDRIGAGPWQNAKGVVIAKNLEELHSANNNLTKDTAVDEKGTACEWPHGKAQQTRHAYRFAARWYRFRR